MTDDHIKSEITLYLAGSLTESRNRQIEAHAASCEKCRNALAKSRAKQSRVKREALKKASPDPLPNLFLARQGKEAGSYRSPVKIPWVVVLLLVGAGVGYKYSRHSAFFSRSSDPQVQADPASVETSTAAAPSPVAAPAPVVAVAPVPEKRAESPKPPLDVQIQQDWQGPDCGIKEARVAVLRNKEAWDQLRGDMQVTLPEVDFEQHVVLGVFAGSQNPGSTVTFGKIRERADDIYAPYKIHIAEVQASSGTAIVPEHPYALALIPRQEKKIRLTQKEVAP